MLCLAVDEGKQQCAVQKTAHRVLGAVPWRVWCVNHQLLFSAAMKVVCTSHDVVVEPVCPAAAAAHYGRIRLWRKLQVARALCLLRLVLKDGSASVCVFGLVTSGWHLMRQGYKLKPAQADKPSRREPARHTRLGQTQRNSGVI